MKGIVIATMVSVVAIIGGYVALERATIEWYKSAFRCTVASIAVEAPCHAEFWRDQQLLKPWYVKLHAQIAVRPLPQFSIYD